MSDDDPFYGQLDTAADSLRAVMTLHAVGRDTTDAGYRGALENAIRELDGAAKAIREALGDGQGSTA